MIDDTPTTEAEAVARIAREAALSTPLAVENGWLTVAVPPGWNVEQIDITDQLPAPTRPRGTIRVYDAASFLAAVNQRTLTGRLPIAYADEERPALVAVLDDDQDDRPGWRQYRVELALRPTAEWVDWKSHSSQSMRQAAFAEFIEEHARDFRAPAAADMLELAQTIEGTKSATFKAGVRLKDGTRQVGWAETVDARAGQTGQLQIPDRFLIAVRPFLGSQPFEIEAWLRFRITDGRLELSYKLDRPDLVEKAVFDDVVAEVAAGGAPVILRAPEPS